MEIIKFTVKFITQETQTLYLYELEKNIKPFYQLSNCNDRFYRFLAYDYERKVIDPKQADTYFRNSLINGYKYYSLQDKVLHLFAENNDPIMLNLDNVLWIVEGKHYIAHIPLVKE